MKEHSSPSRPIREPLVGAKGRGRTGEYPPELRPERIVELGCRAGRNAGELLKKYPKAHVTAIDYSPLSVQKAGRKIALCPGWGRGFLFIILKE